MTLSIDLLRPCSLSRRETLVTPNNSGGFGLMPEIYHCLLAKQEFTMLFGGVKCKAVKEPQWITDSVRISLGRSTRKEALLGKPAVAPGERFPLPSRSIQCWKK
jgi:hypothetical protein